MVEIGDHVQEFVLLLQPAAVAEKSLAGLGRIDRDGGVLLGIGGEAPAVFVDVLVVGRLVEIPDAAIAVVLLLPLQRETGAAEKKTTAVHTLGQQRRQLRGIRAHAHKEYAEQGVHRAHLVEAHLVDQLLEPDRIL